MSGDMSTGDLLKFAGVIITGITGILGIVIKVVFNGTAERSKDIQAKLIAHQADVRQWMLEQKDQNKEQSGMIDNLVTSLHSVDIRLARMEGKINK